jgi:hypothetical protein
MTNAKLVLLAAAALFSAACSGDATGPSLPNLTGSWRYTATNLSGSGASCSIANMSVSLTQAGSTFTGTTVGGVLTCTAGGQSFTEQLGGAIVANGQINGNSVSFDFGTPDFHNTGAVSGNSVSGSAVIRVDVGTAVINLVGNFSMIRT